MQRPIISLLLMLAVYIIWLPFGALFSWFATWITTPGMAVISLLLALYVGRFIATMLIFPGSITAVAKGMEREVANKLRIQLVKELAEIQLAAKRLYAVQDLNVRPEQVHDKIREAVVSLRFSPEMTGGIETLKQMEQNKQLSPHAAVFLYQLSFISTLREHVSAWIDASTAASFDKPAIVSTFAALLPAIVTFDVPCDLSWVDSGIVVEPHILDGNPASARVEDAMLRVRRIGQANFTLSNMLTLLFVSITGVMRLGTWLEVVPVHNDWFTTKEVGEDADLDRKEITRYCRQHHRTWVQYLHVLLKRPQPPQHQPAGHSTVEASAHPLAAMMRTPEQSATIGLIGCSYGGTAMRLLLDYKVLDASAHAQSPGESVDQVPARRLSIWDSIIEFVRKAAWKAFLMGESIAGLIVSFVNTKKLPSPVFGLDFMRMELIRERHAVHMWIQGANGNKVDAVYIPSPQRQLEAACYQSMECVNARHRIDGHWSSRMAAAGVPQWLLRCLRYSSSRTSPLTDHSSAHSSEAAPVNSRLRSYAASCPATVLVNNPNAGLYEYTHRQSDLLDFYHEMGFDIILYNYRGYARSTGSTTPAGIMADAEVIVKFLQSDLGARKVIIHGESIGGVAACHLAKQCRVDLVVADRNFDTLPRTANALMGPAARVALQLVTRWTASNAHSFQNSRGCAKIICFDPNDEVIRWPSGLAVGVARAELELHQKLSIWRSAVDAIQNKPTLSLAEASLRTLAAELMLLLWVLANECATDLTAVAEWNKLGEELAQVQVPKVPFPEARTIAVAGCTGSVSLGDNDPLRLLLSSESGNGAWVPPAAADRATALLQRQGICIDATSPLFSVSTIIVSGELHGDVQAFVADACNLASKFSVALQRIVEIQASNTILENHQNLSAQAAQQAGMHSTPAMNVAHKVAASLPAEVGDAARALDAAFESSTDVGRLGGPPANRLRRYQTLSDDHPLPAGGNWTDLDSGAFCVLPLIIAANTQQSGLEPRSYLPLALLGILCAMDNGTGIQLGEAWRKGGLESIFEYLACSVTYGCPLQKGFGAGLLHEPSVLGRPLGRQPKHLWGSGETGVQTTLRRLDALLAGIQTPMPLSTKAAVEACRVTLRRVQAVQDLLCAKQLPSTDEDKLAEIRQLMTSKRGLCVPLASGHNAAWSASEKKVVAAAIIAQIFHDSSTQQLNPLLGTTASTTQHDTAALR